MEKEQYSELIAQIRQIEFADILQAQFGYIKQRGSSVQETILKGNIGTVHIFKSKKWNGFAYKMFRADDFGDFKQFLEKYHGFPSTLEGTNRIIKIISKQENLTIHTPLFQMMPPRANSIALDLSSLATAGKVHYLLSRGLSDRIVRHAAFKNLLFNTPSGRFNNVSFPLYNSMNKLVGIEMRNKDFKGQVKGGLKATGIWQSGKQSDLSLPLKYIISGESPIAVMSFAELHPQYLNNSLFTASFGAVANEQFIAFQQLIDTAKPQQFILVNDNDKAGVLYDLKYSTNLKIPSNELSESNFFKILKPDFLNLNNEAYSDWNELLMDIKGLYIKNCIPNDLPYNQIEVTVQERDFQNVCYFYFSNKNANDKIQLVNHFLQGYQNKLRPIQQNLITQIQSKLSNELSLSTKKKGIKQFNIK